MPVVGHALADEQLAFPVEDTRDDDERAIHEGADGEWRSGCAANLHIPLKHSGMSFYPDRLLDHFKNPRHVGVLTAPAVIVQVENPACGDILKLSARFEGGRVVDAAFQVRGCTASIASGSALAEWMQGKRIEELRMFQESVVNEAVGGLPAASRHAATLCADGVKALLARLP